MVLVSGVVLSVFFMVMIMVSYYVWSLVMCYLIDILSYQILILLYDHSHSQLLYVIIVIRHLCNT